MAARQIIDVTPGRPVGCAASPLVRQHDRTPAPDPVVVTDVAESPHWFVADGLPVAPRGILVEPAVDP